MHNKISETVFLVISTILGSVLFAAGMSVFLAPVGVALDLIDPAPGWNGLAIMLSLAGLAGVAFGLGMAWYLHHLDSKLVMPELESDEAIRFKQYGYAITDKKYDPARIVITNRRVIILPTHFNNGPKIPNFIASLSDLRTSKNKDYGRTLADKEIRIVKDRWFGKEITSRFLLLKFKNKIVFEAGNRKLAYMPNIGYPLPPLKLFRPALSARTANRG